MANLPPSKGPGNLPPIHSLSLHKTDEHRPSQTSPRSSNDPGTSPPSTAAHTSSFRSSASSAHAGRHQGRFSQPDIAADDAPYVPWQPRPPPSHQAPTLVPLASSGSPDVRAHNKHDSRDYPNQRKHHLEYASGEPSGHADRDTSRGAHEGGSGLRDDRKQKEDRSDRHLPLPYPTHAANPLRYPAFDASGHRHGIKYGESGVALPSTGAYYRPPPPPGRDSQTAATHAAQSARPPHISRHGTSSPSDISSEESHAFGLMPDPDSRGSSCAPPIPYTRPIPAPIESSHRYYPPHALLPGEMETGEILRAQLGIPLGVTVNLNALLDPPPGDKPPEPLPTLMKLAIYGSPSKQLTLQEIYTALEERYEYFRNRTHDTAWKNSIRHALSLHKVFRHAPRPITEPGKGRYWQLDYSQGEGNKRPRKRRGGRGRRSKSDDEDEDSDGNDSLPQSPQESLDESTMANIDPVLRNSGHRTGVRRTQTPHKRQRAPYPTLPPPMPSRSGDAGPSAPDPNLVRPGRFGPGPVTTSEAYAAGYNFPTWQGPPARLPPRDQHIEFGQTSFASRGTGINVPIPPLTDYRRQLSQQEQDQYIAHTAGAISRPVQMPKNPPIPYSRTAPVVLPPPRSGTGYDSTGPLPAARSGPVPGDGGFMPLSVPHRSPETDTPAHGTRSSQRQRERESEGRQHGSEGHQHGSGGRQRDSEGQGRAR